MVTIDKLIAELKFLYALLLDWGRPKDLSLIEDKEPSDSAAPSYKAVRVIKAKASRRYQHVTHSFSWLPEEEWGSNEVSTNLYEGTIIQTGMGNDNSMIFEGEHDNCDVFEYPNGNVS